MTSVIAVRHAGRVHVVEQSATGGPAPAYLQVARWLLAHELGEGEGTQAMSEAAECACQKLLDRLAALITPTGSRALLSRALYLTRADFRFLQGVKPGREPGVDVSGLAKCAVVIDEDHLRTGLASLLGTLIEIVGLFLGERLMARMLLEVWPGLPTRDGF
jgi:hypothetical protein